MKRKITLSVLLAWTFALLFFHPFTPNMQAQSQSPQLSEPQGSDQPKGQIYTGQIVKAKNGQYTLLVDRRTGTGFYLDDQDKAKHFEGQNVRVIGTLDSGTNTIHVSDIYPV